MSYKVLVVDDEPRIHTFIRISLSAEGFDYIGASTIAVPLQKPKRVSKRIRRTSFC